MREAESSSQEGDALPPVADISQLPLDKVLIVGDSALANAVRCFAETLRHPAENYAAHGTTP